MKVKELKEQLEKYNDEREIIVTKPAGNECIEEFSIRGVLDYMGTYNPAIQIENKKEITETGFEYENKSN